MLQLLALPLVPVSEEDMSAKIPQQLDRGSPYALCAAYTKLLGACHSRRASGSEQYKRREGCYLLAYEPVMTTTFPCRPSAFSWEY